MPSNSSKTAVITSINNKNETIRTTVVNGTGVVYRVEALRCLATWTQWSDIPTRLPIISYDAGDGMTEAQTLDQIVKIGDKVEFEGYIRLGMGGLRASRWRVKKVEGWEANDAVEKTEAGTQTEDIEEKPEDSPPGPSDGTDTADAADARPGCVIC